ncbi:similar to Saccharomyces cerevisiae YPL094C SEC62 Essential subunit of Sec63 complex (Sec63p, Sec62p, Sec66p and Sec72p) [Maudiozyma barnettii]|uniref:Translocation protein SEC62 n=1 Tax=Maudiozyma barnettii TaxID=61262 RepID=A0A8H2VHY1_9SACH|nr:Sec63 complex subunit SEC62 [Kazachstania barnettii]CAB4255792.1 similar to Saccharomyces cerevisiae YPL094C SEC62 Essential subunit of Sec63 complex (Sec63p, Sec62p, Sec66p and Sec72p) [Kazachstania barnettii]CAD1784353.1 similar to Saccharomyces cerevisiae YPL094C SEC62 Essential subunit of Sec63 complex (Sec63p, Sec62p, Sec66p and Sec72p) [Kazachstania barnettii]
MSEAVPQGNPQTALAVASLLRRNKLLKQRYGIFQSRTTDFFRYKRFVRALESPQYKKKSSNQPDLYPAAATEAEARLIFITLIKSQIVIPVKKLHSDELKEHDLSPSKDYPHLLPSKQAQLTPDEYYVWNYNPKSFWDYATVVAVVAGILALVCYPLWPMSMRRGSYYVSLAALVFLGAFFVIAILRLILFLVSLIFVSGGKNQGFWIFPNLFEDCGILESFKPLYGFGEQDSYSYIKKQKRLKKRQAKKAKSNEKN